MTDGDRTADRDRRERVARMAGEVAERLLNGAHEFVMLDRVPESQRMPTTDLRDLLDAARIAAEIAGWGK